MTDAIASTEELRPRDFHARITRRSRSHGLGFAGRRKLATRRLGVLAAAIAVPAMAAPGTADRAGAAATHEAVTPMPFETPGESFPGSAFYYLADAPEFAAKSVTTGAESVSGGPERQALVPYAGPAARALRFSASATDRARAERCLTMAIYYEAASESDAGQRAVAQVALNRVAHSAYPDTVCGVVFQGSERQTGCQFTFTCDGSLARAPNAQFWNRARMVARDALNGSVYAPVGLATHYHTIQVHPYWAPSLDHAGTIGAHRFYRWKGDAGRPAAFSVNYVGGEPMPRREAGQAVHAAAAVATLPTIASTGMAFSADEAIAAPAASPARAEQHGPGSVLPEYANSGQWLVQP